ncbi:MAG TPA: hypothetical protein PLQ00_14545, partial [Thermoguttaceae bacterium]|nr:hypothetical protein [Thermoguttaceae bacterium]
MSITKRAKWAGIFFKAWVALLAAIFTCLGMDGVSQAWDWPSEARSSSKAVVPAVVWADWSRSVYSREHVPYFALHPPVYYTQPVGRPYGWSPFAYPSWVQTPLVESPRPMVIQNPYVVGFGPGAKAPPLGDARRDAIENAPSSVRTSRPIRIANPYTAQPNGGTSLPPATPGSSTNAAP